MKKLLLILTAFFTLTVTYGQVSNDSCLSAINLGTVYGNGTLNCIDGTINFDTTLFSGNVNASANFPYVSMTGCQGYTNATANPANDTWFKIKTKDFYIKVFNGISPAIDSLHLNVWHGTNCSSLIPSGCYTFDLITTNPYYVSFAGDTTGGQYTFLQFSGNSLGKTGKFNFCLKGVNTGVGSYYGTMVTTTMGIAKEEIFNTIKISPNPTRGVFSIQGISQQQIVNSQLEIYNVFGAKVYSSIINSDVPNGIYFLQLKTSEGIATKKLVISK